MNYDASPVQYAYLHSLTVENIGPFSERQELSFCDSDSQLRQWTLILGDNGTGKTTLLRVLAGMEIVYRNGRYFPRHNQIRDMWDYVRISEKSRVSGFVLPDYAMIANVALGAELNDEVERSETASVGITRFEDDKLLEVRDTDLPPYYNLQQFKVYGYGATRRIGGKSPSEDAEDFAGRTLFDDDSPLSDPTEFMMQLQLRAHEDLSAQRKVERLKSLLSSLLPDVKPEGVRLASKGKRPTLEFHTSDGWVPIRCLSLGYRALIAWTVDMASRLFERYPESDNPLAEPAIALIDEIDLHLHPAFQRSLLDTLSRTFPKTQFIATAHSPLVVQAAAGLARLVVVRRFGDHVVVDTDLDEVRNWRVDQILTSDIFGLPSGHSMRVQHLLTRRRELLAKPDLAAAEKAEIEELEEQIGQIPVGETPGEIRAMAAIRRLAEAMGQEGKGDQD